MKARRLIVVSVIGAAAVGGALTGTTSASFRGSAGLDTPALRTGSLQVSTSVAQPLGVVDAGATGTSVVTIAASGEGKHLTTTTLIESATVQAPVDLDLKFRQRRDASDDCVGGPYTPWQDKGAGGASPVRVGGEGRPVTQDVCVSVALAGGTAAPAGRHPVRVELGVATRQVRDGETFGWAADDTATITGELLVRPAAPSPAFCSPTLFTTKPDLRFDWSPVADVEQYRVYRVDGPTPVLLGTADGSARSLTVAHQSLGGSLESSRYLIRSVLAGVESLDSREFTLSSARRGWRCRS